MLVSVWNKSLGYVNLSGDYQLAHSVHLLYQNWWIGLLDWVVACNNKHASTSPSNEGQVKCGSCFDEEQTLDECN
jgi:hypothetical protein